MVSVSRRTKFMPFSEAVTGAVLLVPKLMSSDKIDAITKINEYFPKISGPKRFAKVIVKTYDIKAINTLFLASINNETNKGLLFICKIFLLTIIRI